MCGICGEIAFDGAAANKETIARINEKMTRRGPEHGALYTKGPIGFGHRRLKIIDLSDASNQPFVDDDLGLVLVFNGAIYNYKTLRKRLIQEGYTFSSKGDTETILKAYHFWGEACVEKFNGMFAFVVYDCRKDTVFMARDRLGIKPLYYHKNDRCLVFASSLPALLEADGIKKEISPRALHYYMHFHAVVPAPDTVIQGVKKLGPGSTMTVKSDGKAVQRSYWSLDFTRDSEEDHYGFEDWKRLLSDTLMKAVKRRLVSDVPVGVLLSGGLDSSLIVGLLAHAGQQDIKTFSIGFETVGEERGDEFEYSDIIARHFSTDHHKIQADAQTVLPNLPDCVRAMSEPMVSHDCIGFYLLSREVAKYVKVVQSGQGADEIFGGYHWYPPMMESRNPAVDYANVFCDRSHQEFHDIVHERFRDKDFSRGFIEQQFALPGAQAAVDKALRMDATIMLVDDPVKRVDNMTMAASLEARVPFLDHELVELAAKIPPEMKISQGGKHILKEAARDIIPSKVIDRPKGYFPVPALKYIRGKYYDFIKEIVTSPACKNRDVIQETYIDSLLAAPDEHITPLRGSKLWQVALLEFWLQEHRI
nr:N-acetylglutaminylglutamine amidotransferase [uncultured Desulfobacter sp.]